MSVLWSISDLLRQRSIFHLYLMENAPIPPHKQESESKYTKKPAARYPRAGRFSTYVRRLSFGSYAISSSAVSNCAISSSTVAYEAISYAISSEAVSTFSASSSVTARSERDSCESYEHEN